MRSCAHCERSEGRSDQLIYLTRPGLNCKREATFCGLLKGDTPRDIPNFQACSLKMLP
ncbi:hypothetical protein EMIT0347P_10186 [Pseudomonas sp. IT-347P]